MSNTTISDLGHGVRVPLWEGDLNKFTVFIWIDSSAGQVKSKCNNFYQICDLLQVILAECCKFALIIYKARYRGCL